MINSAWTFNRARLVHLWKVHVKTIRGFMCLYMKEKKRGQLLFIIMAWMIEIIVECQNRKAFALSSASVSIQTMQWPFMARSQEHNRLCFLSEKDSILYPLSSINHSDTRQLWLPVSLGMWKRVDSTFSKLHCLVTSHVSEEAPVSLCPPWLVHVVWYGRAGWWVGLGKFLIPIYFILLLKKFRVVTE